MLGRRKGKTVYEWLLLVVGDVELIDIAIEMPRFLEVDGTRDAVQVVKIKAHGLVPRPKSLLHQYEGAEAVIDNNAHQQVCS